MKEQQISNQVMHWLALRNILHVRIRNAPRIIGRNGRITFARDPFWNTQNGVPDILCFHNGHAYGFELKAPKGRVRPEQAEWLQRFAAAGGTACVVRSLEEVAAALGEKI